MKATDQSDQTRFSVVLPADLRREASRYALEHDASLGWAVRRGLGLLLDEEEERQRSLLAKMPPSAHSNAGRARPTVKK